MYVSMLLLPSELESDFQPSGVIRTSCLTHKNIIVYNICMKESQCSFRIQHQGHQVYSSFVDHAIFVSGDNLVSSLEGNSDLIQIVWIEDGKQKQLVSSKNLNPVDLNVTMKKIIHLRYLII